MSHRQSRLVVCLVRVLLHKAKVGCLETALQQLKTKGSLLDLHPKLKVIVYLEPILQLKIKVAYSVIALPHLKIKASHLDLHLKIKVQVCLATLRKVLIVDLYSEIPVLQKPKVVQSLVAATILNHQAVEALSSQT